MKASSGSGLCPSVISLVSIQLTGSLISTVTSPRRFFNKLKTIATADDLSQACEGELYLPVNFLRPRGTGVESIALPHRRLYRSLQPDGKNRSAGRTRTLVPRRAY